MAKKYNFREIEKRWQGRWLKEKVFKAHDDSQKPKYYQLETFPYPSAEGLHVGHPKGYIAEDIHARYMRMRGYEVLYTMGWDAFGLPTENYAIKVAKSPREVAEANIKNFKRQLQMFGLSYDWDREINTSSPKYYKWTQWLFIQLFKKGLAYRAKARVNWCPKDQTVLANEQVVNGKCERCGAEVEQREMEQWFFKITDYAERLLKDLGGLDWPEATIKRQKDWIGKSEGATIEFPIAPGAEKPNFLILHGWNGMASKNFIPWLKKQLEDQDYKVQAPEMPNTKDPKEEEQVNYVFQNCKMDGNTILIGHSLGGVVAMKVLAKHNKPIGGLVLVAPAVDPLFPDPDKDGRPFWKNFTWNFDYDQIKKLTTFRTVLSDLQEKKRIAYLEFLSEKLGAKLATGTAAREHFCAAEEPMILESALPKIKVFTTRPDTLFGATYMVLAPEHQLIQNLESRILNLEEVKKYVGAAKHKTELIRQEEARDKTGIELRGIRAVNPATKEEIPIWIADYVLMGYGTGAIMAVPAHDERDAEFAKKFNLPIRPVIIPERIDHKNPHVPGKEVVFRKVILGIVRNPKTGKYLCLNWKKQPWTTFVIGGIEGEEGPVEAAKREIMEETGYKNIKFLRILGGPVQSKFFAAHKDVNRVAHTWSVLFELENDEHEKISREEAEIHEIVWLDPSEITRDRMAHAELDIVLDRINNGEKIYTDVGALMNSGAFDGMDSEKAKWEITKFVGGEKKIQYKLRDWSVSRQRYWGVPIPIIYCAQCGTVPVPEKDLPVELPPLTEGPESDRGKDYRPKGMPPLASAKDFIETKCPKCGGKAERSAETLDTFVDSSWYYLRYVDPQNDKEIFDRKKVAHWLPVDLYVIGAEHTVLHLLYSRFITKFLHDEGYLDFAEPFLKLRHQGLILGTDGKSKMSKSKGNVVNPDPLIEEFGADTLRLYEMFMGPFEDGAPWDPKGILGVNRFLGRVWNLIVDGKEQVADSGNEKENRRSLRLLHKTIKKVGEDIENFKFNTAISALMILLNELEKNGGQLSAVNCQMLIKLLHPFAPHMAQELWSLLGENTILDYEPWPKYDLQSIQDDKFMLVIQVNSKVRASVEVDADISEAEAKELALAQEKIKKILDTQKPKKVIYVQKKLVNIVV